MPWPDHDGLFVQHTRFIESSQPCLFLYQGLATPTRRLHYFDTKPPFHKAKDSLGYFVPLASGRIIGATSNDG